MVRGRGGERVCSLNVASLCSRTKAQSPTCGNNGRGAKVLIRVGFVFDWDIEYKAVRKRYIPIYPDE